LLRRPALKLLRSSTTTLPQKNQQEKICGIGERDGIAAARKANIHGQNGKAEKKRRNGIKDRKKGKDRERKKEATPGRKSWVG
jgi:hypothetical protein